MVLASNGEGGYYVAEIIGNYYYTQGKDLPHRRAVKWLNVVIPRRSMSQKLQNSTGSIGTCCNITKYADELERLTAGGTFLTKPSLVPCGNSESDRLDCCQCQGKLSSRKEQDNKIYQNPRLSYG